MSRSSNVFLQAVLKGNEPIRQFRELEDPEKLVPLAAAALRDIYPDIDSMEILFSCRDALRRLVNDAMQKRAKVFHDIVKSLEENHD